MGTKIFDLPYIGYDNFQGLELLYTASGDFSVIIQIENVVTELSADERGYVAFHDLLLQLIKTLGEGYILTKQDVFVAGRFKQGKSEEYLQKAFDSHFCGRRQIELYSYLIITKKVERSRFYLYSDKSLHNFKSVTSKVMGTLNEAGLQPVLLDKASMDRYIGRCLSMDFSSAHILRNNFFARENQIDMGSSCIRCISLIDSDRMELPAHFSAHQLKNDGKGMRAFAVDNLSFLHQVPEFECMIYNQVISVPPQSSTLSSLNLKQKRHAGIPDAANRLCMEDISALLTEVARDNQLLVHVHFNIMLCTGRDKIQEASNFIESALFSLGIIPSRNAYNQLELFSACLPGNAAALKNYDLVLLPVRAAACLMFKERFAKNEQSDFLLRFTDRHGLPISIDLADLPMQSGRISNRSKFVLGGSGSGKSFFMNSLVEQYLLYNMDVVIVDTGHSYSGLCRYYAGRYITYSEEHPITMNPFAFSKAEYTIEKRDFLKTLIFLLFKGVHGSVDAVEDTVISSVIASFYAHHFATETFSALNFDAFYHYSVERIKQICEQDGISFEIDAYRFVLRKFCKGEEFGDLLNLPTDSSLLSERLVVFEIDSIREHKVLFPIVTLIIMDVFLQKMRLRHSQRKALILEEAWKAIASELMASYLVYMYKTVRKFYGEAIVVTQELEDIISSPTVKNSIIANSDTICLLDQRKFRDDYAKISSLLSLSEQEQKKIFTINQLDNKSGRGRFKEVYIKRGSTGEVYGVEVSLKQYMTFTTEKPEKLALEHYLNLHGDFRASLDAFFADFESSRGSLAEFIKIINLNQTS
ncbi:TraG family conjugative transposon ATPase [Pedobacter aquatilis]|uniref:TraG family conjugative transposon ATPase n=1 Tax=Pedobacter aquatilis TaxID=351343 RepID=UPI0025B40DFD|nr:TraG family conjugative transposon ATPase [Pedobacter aquatilis]MDN3586158.1 TraG family conjugative transposon ATPase [Pedobacter aquatilis]